MGVHLTFADFLQVCFKYSVFKGETKYKYEFVPYFCTLFMSYPDSDYADSLDQEDNYYPFSNTSQSYRSFITKIFRGVEAVPKTEAAKIYGAFNATGFTDAVYELSAQESFEDFITEFRNKGIEFGESDEGEVLSLAFKKIVTDLSEGVETTSIQSVPLVDRLGRTLDEVEPAKVFIDKAKHKLIVGKQAIDVSYIPFSDEIQLEEQKYIQALLAAYADKNKVDSLTVEDLKKDYLFFYDDLKQQRRFFFDASSVFHAVRDAFSDGENELEILKDEAYDGI